MLPEPLAFPVRLFTVTLIPAKTHPMPALDAVTDLITEVFDEIGGKVFLRTHEDEICGLISNESLVASRTDFCWRQQPVMGRKRCTL